MTAISQRLKRAIQREIASAQDIMVEETYSLIPDAVLHGGTLVWRCYGGNRFSEDLDFYLPYRDEKTLTAFQQRFRKAGFRIEKFRIKERSIYSRLAYGRVEVRFEAIFRKVSSSLLTYECLDGRRIPVRGLLPNEIIREKLGAYVSRRRIRDIYDIYFMTAFVKPNSEPKQLIKFLVDNHKPPIDENELSGTVLAGYVPSSEEIIDYLKRWAG